MSKTVHIESDAQLQDLIKQSKIVVTDFYADWCAPCKAIAPLYEQLSASLSRPQKVTFTKVNTDQQPAVAQRYSIKTIPTFMVFKNGQVVETVKSANPSALQAVVRKLAAEVDATDDGSSATSGGFAESSSSGSSWMGRDLARGYKDVTDQVEVKGLDLLNADPKAGSVRTLFAADKPSALSSGSGSGKGKGKEEDSKGQDWVESDTDEQLMLYVPFQSTLKVHSLQITSIPPAPGSSDGDEDEIPLRPKTIHLYQNRAGVLGFDEAEGIPATQTIVLRPEDWHSETCTATVELRFVKFQNVTSLVLFVEDGEGEGEKVRLDRVRIVGESGEKRTMGKLEKIGDGP